AQRGRMVAGLTPARGAATALAWLTVPLLLWGTGFWLASGAGAAQAGALDRFESSWAALAGGQDLDPALEANADVTSQARSALGGLHELCAQGQLSTDCATSPSNLFRDVRISLVPSGAGAA